MDLYYGNSASQADSVIKRNPEDLIWRNLLEGKCASDGKSNFDFDIVNAIGAFLIDAPNRNPDRKYLDRDGRLKFEGSFQARQGLGTIPLVNAYVLHFRDWLSKRTSIRPLPLWPEGRSCAIGLSHDVDKPVKYPLLRNSRLRKKPSLIMRPRYLSRLAYSSAKYLLDGDRDDFWAFDEIISSETGYGLKSTFFFATESLFDKQVTFKDVQYDIESQRFGGAFESIKKSGGEIGLHAAYMTYLGKERFAAQKEKLERLSGTKVKGLRHHCWHLGPDEERTFRMHEASGFEYDASLAFNESLGFRRNVAMPFSPYDSSMKRELGYLQLPNFCMDANVFGFQKEPPTTIEDVIDFIKTIKRYEGLGVIDWHVRTSYPKGKDYRDWGEGYQRIIKYLANDRDIWTTNLADICEWTMKRKGNLSIQRE
jgi:peptidoglycan/xylan/chitin deacetylase (PgdA/CDA1 family)